MQLARTFYKIERSISASLAAQELTLAQFDVLATLRYGEGVTQKELAELLLVTKGNVVGLLDRLVLRTLDCLPHQEISTLRGLLRTLEQSL